MEIFYGSSVVVRNHEMINTGNYKGFGYEFYCANIEK